ncbi:hypothetical protein PsorP6_012898 [Peronosclerospora sorghi]|uniref:Uncharacterized protein n=1 Tax=Peronosclerospora sorghi TaxID=230839 RepID=A0ACC0WG15_9STRA|nr:hypothetical protein PsorP6_012898 [Peronosclerospora sorghi]
MWVIFSFERKAVGEDLDASLVEIFSSLRYTIVTFIGPALNLFTSLCQDSVALVAEDGSIWYRPETYVIFACANTTRFTLLQSTKHFLFSSARFRECFFYEISGMNTRWQLFVYHFSIVITVGAIIVLSEKHTQHCDPGILSVTGLHSGHI